ncbi:MAG: peptidylprolyl isomerase [Gemmatimonadetes bacterium]|nr:peptidylprolyl isomerase [Gemmatimonadota bacterium]
MNRRPFYAARGAALTGAAALLVLAGACHRYGPIPVEVPDARPPDALLTDPELQQVVELQVRREGAALTAELSSPRSAVRARAAFALGSVQDPGAVPALIQALADTAAAVRRDVAFALGQAGDTMALAPMVSAYGMEKDPEVRHRLLEAMGKLPAPGAPAAVLGLDVPAGEEADRALALARLGAVRGIITEDALRWLLNHLKSPDPAVRENSAYFIGRVRTSAPWTDRAAIVRDALESYRKDDPAGMYLIQGLGRQGDRRNAKPIAEWATSSPDWRMRANAMTAMRPWAPREGREERGDREEREEREEREVGDVAMKGLDDPSIHVAVNAAQTISQRPPNPSDLSEVEEWIDEHPGRWQVAGPLLVYLAKADEREYVFDWLDSLSPDDQPRWNIGLQALAYMGGQEAMDRLTRTMRSGQGPVAADAAVALVGRWSLDRAPRNAPTYFPLFSEALRLGSLRVTYSVAPVLADSVFLRLGSADTLVAAYRRMSPPDDLEGMLAILSALTSAGDHAAEPLMREALASQHPAIRREAAVDLARLTGDTTLAAQSGPTPASGDTAAGSTTDAAKLDWSYLAALGVAPRLVLDTNRGRVVVRMDTDEAPQTVQTVARLAEAGKYDGVPFHRVVPNFVIQGGDFTNKDGSGGPGFTIDSELTLIPFLRGVIGMARSEQKDTEGSQFFITHSMQPRLDGAYTSFGWVVQGMDVVDRIAQGDTLVHASIERGG